jgi:hypothetical protein
MPLKNRELSRFSVAIDELEDVPAVVPDKISIVML